MSAPPPAVSSAAARSATPVPAPAGGDAVPPRLRVRSAVKSYGDLRVLDGLDLDVRPGEFAAVIGPSGAGKSTLFNLVSGLERPTAGEILVDGEPPRTRSGRVAYMPQKDLLFPWRTVLANTALGLEAEGVPRRQARARAAELFEAFGLDGFQHAYPSALSGGMRQRAALLRTVVLGRPLLLLDEPFGALDSLTRADMQRWLLRMWRHYGWTVVLVTHDIREALLLADTVHVMSPRPARVVDRIEVPRPAEDGSGRHPQALDPASAAALEERVLRALRPPTAGGAR
ncbi:ABC transporter ATP-binding protein [Kitasatospora sp. NA04385]|uniref:ABC transporter ATP-binding protein n=1 Tax=Kitasatospora sp. NA04385 TaxID=2742135 RepID=UPI00159160E4|nr:ABC transporter ATP-binding protein [Kitasatospora sp. NA04385]QKW22352.1 ABC transporter ATP-binding protein [Kitasatospora sp. NA04385]